MAAQKELNKKILRNQNSSGKNTRIKLKSFEKSLSSKLKDPKFAVEYLKDALESNDLDGFLLCIRDILEAHGGLGQYAKKNSALHRVSLYKAFSNKGNPLFASIMNVLESLGIGLRPYVKQVS